ncbi:MAG: MmgE/PrpD family protein [Eubacterium sp.]|nr:MmgE/PrpD family protein [Eubacterium sp.]
MQNISKELCRFIAELKYEDIPEEVIETQKLSVLDAVGITMGANTLGDGCAQMVQLCEELAAGGKEEATVIGFSKKLPMIAAAMANGAMAHSLDFGDTQMEAGVHSNASSFPAVLALAEKLGNIDGKTFLTALVAGSEAACRIALAVNVELIQYGFYPPTIYSSYGAAAACCRLLGLTPEQTENALAFNLCQTTCSAEITSSSTTVVRSVREAFAVRNALTAALMAQKNLAGFDAPLEGKAGLFASFARGEASPERITEDLGSRWYSGSLYFKLWPSCAGTHPDIRALSAVMKENRLSADDIEEVRVTVSQRNSMLIEPEEVRKAPENAIIAKFSVPFACSVMAVKGAVGLSDFMGEALKDKAVLDFCRKFTCSVNEGWGPEAALTTEMTVITKDGRSFYNRQAHEDAYAVPADYEEVRSKMEANAAFAKQKKTEEELGMICETVRTLEKCTDIRAFAALL